MIQVKTVVAAVVVFGLLIPSSADAILLLDQQPGTTDSGVFSDEGFDIFLLDPDKDHSQSVAENFQVATAGAGFSIEEIVVWGAFDPYGGSVFPAWDDVDVLVHADDGGLPGTVLCSESNVTALRQATGSTVSGLDEYKVTLTLGTPCGLSDGTYWVEVYYNTGIGFDDWFWEFGTLDPVHGVPNIAIAQENPGEQWTEHSVTPINEVAVQLWGSLGTVACVNNAAGLQAALTAASINDTDDVIQVVGNSYVTPGSAFTYSTAKSHDLQLLGGFSPGCTDRTLAPAITVLDGAAANPVLVLQSGPSTSGNILVQGLTVENGLGVGGETAGLSVGGEASFTGRITVSHMAIRGNQADAGVAGLWARTAGGLLTVINNLVVGNTSSSGGGGGFLSCSGEVIWVTNNTVADNTSCGNCVDGFELAGTAPPTVSNNILWGNGTVDLVFPNLATLLMNNDIGSYSGLPEPASSGNISADPMFNLPTSYRVKVGSPVVNQGTNNPAGGLPDLDLAGRNRILQGQVDMGAFEGPTVFFSGFEDLTLSDWSLVIGLVGD